MTNVELAIKKAVRHDAFLVQHAGGVNDSQLFVERIALALETLLPAALEDAAAALSGGRQ